MSETSFKLVQKAFPGMSRNIEVDLESLKIKVFCRTFFKRRTFTVDLYEINENPLRISKTPIFWLVFSLFLSFHTFLGVISCLTHFKSASFFPIMITLCFTTGTLLSWYKYCEERLEVLVYTRRFQSTERELFSLIADSKNTTEYHLFISRLEEVLRNLRMGRDLRIMIEQTPRKILLEEFRASYIEELLKRDIDVIHFLESLQEQFISENLTLFPKKYLN